LKTVAADTSPRDNVISVREWLDFATERVPQLQEQKLKSRDLGLQTDSPATAEVQKNSSIGARSTAEKLNVRNRRVASHEFSPAFQSRES